MSRGSDNPFATCGIIILLIIVLIYGVTYLCNAPFAFIGSLFHSHSTDTSTTTTVQEDTPLPTATPTPSLTDLGGLSLSNYCQYLGYDDVSLDGNTARDWHCVRQYHDVKIDMSSACDWTYQRNDLTAGYLDYNDPNSWKCYSPQNEDVGGIPNLGGYCQSLGYVDISRDGDTALDWHCIRRGSANIDMTKACQWQYKRNDATAHTDNYNDPNSWQCYAPG